jgi:hypothetical protein
VRVRTSGNLVEADTVILIGANNVIDGAAATRSRYVVENYWLSDYVGPTSLATTVIGGTKLNLSATLAEATSSVLIGGNKTGVAAALMSSTSSIIIAGSQTTTGSVIVEATSSVFAALSKKWT